MNKFKNLRPKLQVIDGRPMASSLEMARDFGLAHIHLLGIVETVRLMRWERCGKDDLVDATCVDAQGLAQPMVWISHDGFYRLLIGLSGRRAQQCAAAYMMAFGEHARPDAGGAPAPWSDTVPAARFPDAVPMHGELSRAMDLLDALSHQTRH